MRERIKRSVSYSFSFRLLEGLVFAPLVGLAGQVLRGRAVVDSTALVGYFLSPGGLLATLIAGVSFLMIRMMEQAGLSLLAAGPDHPPAWMVLRRVFGHVWPLFRAAARFLIIAICLLLPFLVAAGATMRFFLSSHDINFYLAEPPPLFVGAGIALAILGAVTIGFLAWAMVRWRWVVHVILFEHLTGSAAFRRSADLVRNFWWPVALRWAGIGLLNVALGFAAAWIGRSLLPLGVAWFGGSFTSLGALFGALLVSQAVIGSLVLMSGPILEAGVFTRLYFQRAGRVAVAPTSADIVASSGLSPLVLAGAMFLLIALGGLAGGLMGTHALAVNRPVAVIAHRAAMKNVPENSTAAVEQAIREGADVAEIDVQLTSDGVVALSHDRDFARVGGMAKDVTALTWAEVKAIDIGAHLSPDHAGVMVPRLEEILAAAKHRIRLNIELKHYRPLDGALEREVVRLVREAGLVNETEIQSLEYEALKEVRRLEPGLKIGYLMSVNARQPAELDVDFLSAQTGRINGRFIRQARRAGQKVYAWTVDDRATMEQLIDAGVDGLITNESFLAAQVMRERRSLTPRDAAILRIRAWLAT